MSLRKDSLPSDIRLGVLNFGKLAERVSPERNIVYFRNGLDEISLNITNACPNACTFCIRDRDIGWGVSNLYLAEDPTVEEINNAFNSEHDRIIALGTTLRKVKICGYGEPILRFHELPGILDNIVHFGTSARNIQLTTTGWPYFRFISSQSSRISELKEAGLTDVYLSLSSTDRDVYRRLVRPGVDVYDETAFDDSIRFGIAARDAGLNVTLGFINLAGLKETDVKDLADELGVQYRIREFER